MLQFTLWQVFFRSTLQAQDLPAPLPTETLPLFGMQLMAPFSLRVGSLLSLLVLSACAPTSDNEDTSTQPDSGSLDTGEDTGEGSSQVLEENFQLGLNRFGGCGDVFMYASNPDDTLVMTFQASGGATLAHEAGETIDILYDLTSEDASLTVVYGENVSHEHCNDALWLEVIERKVFETTAGEATLRITPDPDAPEGVDSKSSDAILYLSNVVLEAPDGETTEIEQFTYQASVGWLPG